MGRDRVLNPPESGFSHELPDNDIGTGQVDSDKSTLSEVIPGNQRNIGVSIYLPLDLVIKDNLLYLNEELTLTDDAGGQCTDHRRTADGSSSRTASEEGRWPTHHRGMMADPILLGGDRRGARGGRRWPLRRRPGWQPALFHPRGAWRSMSPVRSMPGAIQ